MIENFKYNKNEHYLLLKKNDELKNFLNMSQIDFTNFLFNDINVYI